MSLIPQKGEKSKVTMPSKKVCSVAPDQPGVMTKSNSWNVNCVPRSSVDIVKTSNSNSAPSSPTSKNTPKKPLRPKPSQSNTRIPKPKGKENVAGAAGNNPGLPRGSRIVKPVVRPSKAGNCSAFGSDSFDSNQVATSEDRAMIEKIGQSPFNHSPLSPFIVKSTSSLTSTPSSTQSNSHLNPGENLYQSLQSPGFSPYKEPGDVTPTASPNKMNKSPLILSSRAVPDLHNKLLAKLKANKRRSGCQKTPNKSPTKAPAPMADIEDEDVFCGEGESDSSVGSISSSRSASSCSNRSDSSDSPNPEELEFLLGSMFTTCDEYRTGQVPSGKLLEYLLALVEVPSLNKWKIDELSRMLDPQQDNRYVDEELFQAAGKKWIDMMLDPMCHDSDCHPDSPQQDIKAPIGINTPSSRSSPPRDAWCQLNISINQKLNSSSSINQRISNQCFKLDHFSEFRRRTGSLDFNISYGSMEGLGGIPGCSSDEVELQNRVSELRYQLDRAGEEQMALQNALTMQEDANAMLTNELDLSRRRVGTLKDLVERTNLVNDELENRSQTDEQCCNLSVQVEQLLKEKEQKELLEEEKDHLLVQLAQCRREIEEKERREKELLMSLNVKDQQCNRLGVGIVEREEQLNQERDAREGMEGRLEDLSREVERMEEELSVKDHELRSFTNITGNTTNSNSLNLSTLHDVSVDDRVLEEARMKPLPVTPSRLARPPGPSASSTPSSSTKKDHPVSIGDEMKQLGLNSSFPSPFCEKEKEGGHNSSVGAFSCLLLKFRKELESKQAGLAEKLRKVICGEAEAEETGRMMVALNQTMAGFTKELLEQYNVMVEQLEKSEKGRSNLTDKLAEAQDKSQVASPAFGEDRIEDLGEKMLEEKNLAIRELEKELAEAKEGQILEQDLQEVEAKVLDMAGLLQVANQALLVAGQSRSGTPNTTITRSFRCSPMPDSSMDLDIDTDLLNDWQHDYDGLELVEWNTNLSKKLMQYANASRILLGRSSGQELIDLNDLSHSRMVMSSPRTWKSATLFTKLAELDQEASRSRDLLVMAGESMREEMSLNVSQNLVAPTYPKTVACQTVEVVEVVEEMEEDKEDDETVEEAWWPGFLTRLVCAILLGLVYFTFCCGIEIEGVEYYPFTWYPLRYVKIKGQGVNIKWSHKK